MSGHVAGRYQMRGKFQLPQFISPKNPFAADATADVMAEESSSPVATPEPVAVVSAVTHGRKFAAFVGRVGDVAKRAALWCLDHVPFSGIGRPHLPAMPRFGKPQVQGEFTLDKVHVVRADLVHADLEVVRSGKVSNAGPNVWRALTTRVLGGGTR